MIDAPNLGMVPGASVEPPPDDTNAGEAPAGFEVRPERLRIARLGIDAPVVAVGVDASGSLHVPVDREVIGWWEQGALPGGVQGTAILTGHVNTAEAGPGAFFELSRLRPGDDIVVGGGGRTIRFRVEALRRYTKTELPPEEAFSQEVAGRLALVTCGGPFDLRTGHYRDNVIAYALPA